MFIRFSIDKNQRKEVQEEQIDKRRWNRKTRKCNNVNFVCSIGLMRTSAHEHGKCFTIFLSMFLRFLFLSHFFAVWINILSGLQFGVLHSQRKLQTAKLIMFISDTKSHRLFSLPLFFLPRSMTSHSKFQKNHFHFYVFFLRSCSDAKKNPSTNDINELLTRWTANHSSVSTFCLLAPSIQWTSDSSKTTRCALKWHFDCGYEFRKMRKLSSVCISIPYFRLHSRIIGYCFAAIWFVQSWNAQKKKV